jgi:hypothetical protein
VPLSKTLTLTHYEAFRLLASQCRGRYIVGFGRLGGLEDEKQIPPLRCGMTKKSNDNKKSNCNEESEIAAREAVGTRSAVATREQLQRVGLINRLNRVATGCRLFSNKGRNDVPETFSVIDSGVGLSSCCAYRDGCADQR